MLFLYFIACGEKNFVDSGASFQFVENVDETEEGVEEQNTEETQESENNDSRDGDNLEEEESEEEESEEEESEEEESEEGVEEQGNSESENTNEESEYEENNNTSEPNNEQESYTGNESCDVNDLLWNIRVLDDNESSISPYSTTTSLTIVGEVTNNCDGELVLSTMTDCIVYSGTLYANSGLGTHIWTNACQVFSTNWVFAPYETKSQTEIISSRPEDHYELTIYFADSQTTMVQYGFDVE